MASMRTSYLEDPVFEQRVKIIECEY